MKGQFRYIQFLFLLLGLALSPRLAESQQINIGAIATLSGEATTWGFDVRDSLLFANKHLTNNQYELVFEDEKCDPKEGLTATKRLLEFSKLKYVLGFTCSGPAIVSAPIFNKHKVPLIITSASSPKLKDAGDFVFRTVPTDGSGALLLVKHILSHEDLSKLKMGVLSSEAEYPQDLKNAFIKSLNEKGTHLKIETVDYAENVLDFKIHLLKLRSKGVNSLFINAQYEQSFITILKQLREYKWKPKLYAAYSPANPTVLNAKPENLEGIVFYDSPNTSELLNEEGKKLFEKYKEEYGAIRSSEAIFLANYEGFRAMHMAISSGEDVRTYLKKTKFNGIFGPWHFDDNGEIVGLNFGLKTIKNFQVVEIK